MRPAAALLVLAGCGPSGFELAVQVPDRYRAAVDELRVRALDPPGATPFDCDALAFGQVDPAVVAASLDRELPLAGAETELGTFDRAGPHLFVAEARAAGGQSILRGCAEGLTLDDGQRLALTLEPVTAVDAEPPPLGGLLGDPLAPIPVEVTDLLGAPVSEARVRWTLSARGGVSAAVEARAGPDGRLSLSPVPPDRAGPFALDLYVRWAAEGPLRVSGLLRGAERITALPRGRVTDAEVATFRGRDTLALLLEDGGASSLVFCQGALACGPAFPLPSAGGRMARLEDGLVLVTASRFFAFTSTGAPASVPGPGAAPSEVLVAGSCEGAERVLVRYPDSGAELFTRSGQNLEEPAPLDGFEEPVLASGCVDTFDGRRARAYVLGSTVEGNYLAADLQGTLQLGDWSGSSAVVTVGVRGAGVLLSAERSLQELVIARSALEVSTEGAQAEVLEVDPTPAEPARIAGARLDGDDALDLLALLRDVDPERGRTDYFLHATLDDAPGGERINGTAALALGLCPATTPDLVAGDLDGDGDDDVVLIDHGEACGVPDRVVLLPM